MTISNYIFNIGLTVFGLSGCLEYTLRASRLKGGLEQFLNDFVGYVYGLTGLWNLICLLVKLNVIHP